MRKGIPPLSGAELKKRAAQTATRKIIPGEFGLEKKEGGTKNSYTSG